MFFSSNKSGEGSFFLRMVLPEKAVRKKKHEAYPVLSLPMLCGCSELDVVSFVDTLEACDLVCDIENIGQNRGRETPKQRGYIAESQVEFDC
jgi:hypothetical protein